MTLQELKQNILDRKIGDNFMIFVCEENYFLADQYIEGICNAKHFEKNTITSLSETLNSSFALVFDYTARLNILKIDEFVEFAADYSTFKNCIVVCKKVDKRIQEQVKDYIIDMPKLVDWQVKDYMKVICPGIEETDIDWLYKVTSGDIYKITNELDKVNIFPTDIQKKIFNDLRFDKANSLYLIALFDLANAIAKNDRITVSEYLKHRSNCKFEPMTLVSLLLNKFKNIILINFNSGSKIVDLGISSGQAYYLKKDFAGLTLGQCMKTLDFLSSIDQKLKNGQLEFSQDNFIDYLITNMMR